MDVTLALLLVLAGAFLGATLAAVAIARARRASLPLPGGHAIRAIAVEEGDWLAGRTLDELELFAEGVVVLGVERAAGAYLHAPEGEVAIEAGDVVHVYGRERALAQIEQRREGALADREHRAAVESWRLQHEVETTADARGRPLLH